MKTLLFSFSEVREIWGDLGREGGQREGDLGRGRGGGRRPGSCRVVIPGLPSGF